MTTLRRVALLGVVLTLGACASGETSEATVEASPEPTAFEKVIEGCDVSSEAIRDEGATLVLNGRGSDDVKYKDGEATYPEGTLANEDLVCALGIIGTPDSVITKMEKTRALDGMQDETADGFSYSWTYHPNAGLDIIVTTAS